MLSNCMMSKASAITKIWRCAELTDTLNTCGKIFLTSKNIFITLQYFGDILGILLKQTFVECSSNNLETLLRYCCNLPKDQYSLISNHALLTQKQFFHRELFKKSFPLKCSLNAPWMSRTLQQWGSTQRIFPEYSVLSAILKQRKTKYYNHYFESNWNSIKKYMERHKTYFNYFKQFCWYLKYFWQSQIFLTTIFFQLLIKQNFIFT